MKAIDLYSGIGGWTLGMKLAGIENVKSFEWWKEANTTHNNNFGTDHSEFDIRQMNPKVDLNFKDDIDIVVGSPPCTQFSYANRGGAGDISDGLIDVYKFLEAVEYLNPKYWAMENVPRVANILRAELGIGGELFRFRELVKTILIVDSSDYGVPQKRKRMVAGNFPETLFQEYKTKIPTTNLDTIYKSLQKDVVVDPLYGYKLSSADVTDNENEPDLTKEELRINRDAKEYHPVYNKMSFPDQMDRPARTVTATCTRVSRESIIVESKTGYRRLNVRERGLLQGFPITYQFYGNSMNSKFKMIGNAVPPILTYYLFQSMLEVSPDKVQGIKQCTYKHPIPEQPLKKVKMETSGRKFPKKRKFMFAIPNLRFGSGVRFELSNSFGLDDEPIWRFKFFYGNSKSIKRIELNNDLFEEFFEYVIPSSKELFIGACNSLEKINSLNFQLEWIHEKNEHHPFEFIDEVGQVVKGLAKAKLFGKDTRRLVIEKMGLDNRKKVEEFSDAICIGFLLLSYLNSNIISKNENRSDILSSERLRVGSLSSS